MKRRLRWLGSLLVLTACQPGTAGLGAWPPAVDATAVSLQERGHLRIRIKWPTHDQPNFQAQAIPLRTRSLRFTTWNAQDAVVDTRVVSRDEPGALIPLPAGTGYRLAADAFAETTPTDESLAIAHGNATNVTIWKSKTTSVPLTLTATFAPTLTRLDPAYGLPGALVILEGTRFGASEAAAYEVTFGGIPAEATRSSDTRLVAKVPSGLSVGRLVNVGVKVDGIPGTTVAPFLVDHSGLDVEVVPGDWLEGHGLALELDATASGEAGGFGLILQ